METGDFVKGLPGSGEVYDYTNELMPLARVTAVSDDGKHIAIKVLEQEQGQYGTFQVEAKYFEVVGHVAPFDREEALKRLAAGEVRALIYYDLTDADLTDANLTDANLTRADLTRANLRGAAVPGANFDFGSFPLWCGGLRLKTDLRLPRQLAYHLCALQCGDPEFIALRNTLLEFANKFHRVGEVPALEEITLPEE
jgi:hypothetical protein